MKIYPNADLGIIAATSHPVFKAVEAEFNAWYDSAPNWIREAYDGYGEDEPGAFNREGAIDAAIEGMIDEANATGKPVDISKYDTAAHFQPC